MGKRAVQAQLDPGAPVMSSALRLCSSCSPAFLTMTILPFMVPSPQLYPKTI